MYRVLRAYFHHVPYTPQRSKLEDQYNSKVADIVALIMWYASSEDLYVDFKLDCWDRAFTTQKITRYDDCGTWYPICCRLGSALGGTLIFTKEQITYRDDSQLKNEWEVYQGLPTSSPYISTLIGKAGYRRSPFGTLIFKAVDGSNLDQWQPKSLTWRECVVIWADVCEGLAFLHEHGFVHHDVSCKNIMISTLNRAVLCDLGIAEKVNKHGHTDPNNRRSGSQTMAPERRPDSTLPITTKLDMFETSVVAYRLAYLMQQLYFQPGDYKFPDWYVYLIHCVTRPNLEDRPTAKEMFQVLRRVCDMNLS